MKNVMLVIFVIVKVELGCGLTRDEIWNLRKAAKEALGEASEGTLNLLLEDKSIHEAACAYEIIRKRRGHKLAKMATWQKLLMVMGKAR